MKKKENKKNLSSTLPTNRDKFSLGEGAGSARKKDDMKKKENKGILSTGEGEKNLNQEAKAGSEHPFLPIEKGEYGFSREGVKQVKNRISTVLHIEKPSAIGKIFYAEGCISEFRAIRACLMIRIYNN